MTRLGTGHGAFRYSGTRNPQHRQSAPESASSGWSAGPASKESAEIEPGSAPSASDASGFFDFDFDGDGALTDKDAIHLLYFVFYPEEYPLYVPWPEEPGAGGGTTGPGRSESDIIPRN